MPAPQKFPGEPPFSTPSTPHVLTLFDLTGRVAVVTGGAGLLGGEFCRTLAEAGAAVVVADINEVAAQQLVDHLSARKLRALAVRTDVTSLESVQQMAATVLKELGRLDILVNSAALDPKMDPRSLDDHAATDRPAPETGRRPVSAGIGAFEDFPLETWNQALAVNLTGAFLCCQAAAPAMLAQGKGVIINLSSIYGLVAPDQRLYETVETGRRGENVGRHIVSTPRVYKPVYYTVTKEGILGLTKYLAAYYAGKNIRVNAISPGGVYNGHDETFVKAYSAKAILGRMADKSDINGALLFLASDASQYMTGANLVVDGGWSIW